MSSIREKAALLLQNCEVVILTSVNQEGYPRPVPMSKIKTEDISVIWFATGRNSVKTKDFRADPKAGACFYLSGDSVALTGNVDIVTDPESKLALWQEWFINHFPGGPQDPEYVLLKFRAEEATFWIDGKFIHRKLK